MKQNGDGRTDSTHVAPVDAKEGNLPRVISPLCVLLAIGAPAVGRSGTGPRWSQAFRTCVAPPDEPSRCGDQELIRQDARLNGVYKALIARLPAPRQAALRASERRWISDRDALCSDAGEGQGECKAEQTLRRIDQLQRLR